MSAVEPRDYYASKHDLAEKYGELKAEIVGLRGEVETLRGEVARVETKLDTMSRTISWGLSIITALIVAVTAVASALQFID